MIEITRGREELVDAVRPLWLALRDHHHQVAPALGPVRSDDDTWARRRANYTGWLADDERSFLLLARRDGEVLGYAFVRPVRHALELETLSVLPAARGAGLGARLIALVREEVARGGYEGLYLSAVATNADALRFYEREGFRAEFIHLRDTTGTP
jgi:GNAT superfamily N-acetyltransferase